MSPRKAGLSPSERRVIEIEENRCELRSWYASYTNTKVFKRIPVDYSAYSLYSAYSTGWLLFDYVKSPMSDVAPDAVAEFLRKCARYMITDEPKIQAEMLFAWLSWLADAKLSHTRKIRQQLTRASQQRIADALGDSGKGGPSRSLMREALSEGINPEIPQSAFDFHNGRGYFDTDYLAEFLLPPPAFVWSGRVFNTYGWLLEEAT